MYAIQNTLHDLRYKVDYMIIDYKQRYYSSNRNPRIIQTKFKDQKLFSLRTCPHDKYLVKPGEYLALERTNYNNFYPDYSSNYTESQTPEDASGFSGFDGMLFPNEKFDSQLLGDRRVQSVPELLSLRNAIIEQPCSCKCCQERRKSEVNEGPIPKFKEEILQSSTPNSPGNLSFSKSQRMKEKLMNGIGFSRRKRGRERNLSIPSLIIELDSDLTNLDHPQGDIQLSSQIEVQNGSFDDENPELKLSPLQEQTEALSSSQLNYSTPPFRRFSFNNSNSALQSIVSSIGVSNVGTGQQLTDGRNGVECSKKENMDKKTDLDDVSKPVRVSTAHLPRTTVDSRNLTSNSIDAKSSVQTESRVNKYMPTEIFAVNLEHIKPKPNNDSKAMVQTDKLDLSKISEPIEQINENVSRYSTVVSTSRPVSNSDFYSENGILSMYYYNSDN